MQKNDNSTKIYNIKMLTSKPKKSTMQYYTNYKIMTLQCNTITAEVDHIHISAFVQPSIAHNPLCCAFHWLIIMIIWHEIRKAWGQYDDNNHIL